MTTNEKRPSASVPLRPQRLPAGSHASTIPSEIGVALPVEQSAPMQPHRRGVARVGELVLRVERERPIV